MRDNCLIQHLHHRSEDIIQKMRGRSPFNDPNSPSVSLIVERCGHEVILVNSLSCNMWLSPCLIYLLISIVSSQTGTIVDEVTCDSAADCQIFNTVAVCNRFGNCVPVRVSERALKLGCEMDQMVHHTRHHRL